MNTALLSSRSVEWYTPADLANEIAAFFGGAIALDPCADPLDAVPALRHEHGDGLAIPWDASSVFCNPPYRRDVTGRWVYKAIAEHDAGRAHEIVLLIPARTDTRWFTPLYRYVICFIAGRLHFSGSTSGAPFPSALVYLGPRRAAFMRAFAHRGVTVTALDTLDAGNLAGRLDALDALDVPTADALDRLDIGGALASVEIAHDMLRRGAACPASLARSDFRTLQADMRRAADALALAIPTTTYRARRASSSARALQRASQRLSTLALLLNSAATGAEQPADDDLPPGIAGLWGYEPIDGATCRAWAQAARMTATALRAYLRYAPTMATFPEATLDTRQDALGDAPDRLDMGAGL